MQPTMRETAEPHRLACFGPIIPTYSARTHSLLAPNSRILSSHESLFRSAYLPNPAIAEVRHALRLMFKLTDRFLLIMQETAFS